MRLRATLIALSILSSCAASSALAHPVMAPPMAGPPAWGGSYGGWSGAWQPPYTVTMPGHDAPPAYDREGWLRDCRQRLGDNGVGGAVIGGVLGGVAGNVIAGPGDRVLGTVAGAAVGAVAGAAIDKGEDHGRVRDRCEAMLEGGAGFAPPGYTVVMVPVMMVPIAQPPARPRECTETVVTEEYAPAPVRRSRFIPRRAPDKRVKIVPDKRIAQ